MSDESATPVPKRRWFRFRLRTLFVVVTVVGAFVGFLRWNAIQTRERREFIARYWLGVVEEAFGIDFSNNSPPNLDR